MLNKVKHDKRHQRRETYGGGLGLVVVRFKRPTDIMACRGSCSWRSAASTRASIPSKSNSGGCCSQVHAKYMWQRIAKYRWRLLITQGGARACCCACARSKQRPRMPCRGSCAFCSTRANILLMAKSHDTGGRCAMCDVWRVSLCDVCRVSLKIKKVTRKWSTDRRCADARAAAQRQRDAAPHRCAKKRAVER